MKGELSKLERTKLEYYKVIACSLHGMNRALENAVVKSFGKCAMDIYNFHHYLFSHYTAQEYLGESFAAVWEEATGKIYIDKNNKLQKPVLTRWWSVMRCADQVVETHEDWKKFMNYVHDIYGTTVVHVHQGARSALGKVAKSATEVGKSDKIIADLYFFVAFGAEYFKKHMKWRHATNPLARTFGHSCNDMPIRCLTMKWELEDLILNDSWMGKDTFHEAVMRWRELPSDEFGDDERLKCAGKETTMKQWKDFFVVFQDTLLKHTRAWYDTELLPFAIASPDAEVASVFAAALLGVEVENGFGSDIDSKFHGCKIDLSRWK